MVFAQILLFDEINANFYARLNCDEVTIYAGKHFIILIFSEIDGI